MYRCIGSMAVLEGVETLQSEQIIDIIAEYVKLRL